MRPTGTTLTRINPNRLYPYYILTAAIIAPIPAPVEKKTLWNRFKSFYPSIISTLAALIYIFPTTLSIKLIEKFTINKSKVALIYESIILNPNNNWLTKSRKLKKIKNILASRKWRSTMTPQINFIVHGINARDTNKMYSSGSILYSKDSTVRKDRTRHGNRPSFR